MSKARRSRVAQYLRAIPCLLLLIHCAPAAAQVGRVSGGVVDAAGKPVGYADVSLEPDGGTTWSGSELSAEDGTFSFAAVPAGTYKLSAFASGFAPREIVRGIVVTSASSHRFTITLVSTSAGEEFVEVNGEEDRIIHIDQTADKKTVDESFIAATPVQGDGTSGIIETFTGVARQGPTESEDLSINGGSNGQIGRRVDGGPGNDVIDGGGAFDIAGLAISRATLVTGGEAEYGEQSSAVVEFETKSGTDSVDFACTSDVRDTQWGAQGVPGLARAAKDVDDLLRAEGTAFEPVLETGFGLLGVDRLSTLDDDHDPTPRHRVHHAVSAGGPIIPGRLWAHATLDAGADDSGNPYADGMLQTDRVLFTGKVDWDAGGASANGGHRLSLTASADVSDSSGFAGLTSTRDGNLVTSRTAWSVTCSDVTALSKKLGLESRLTLTHSATAIRPEDTRTGVGTQYEVLLPPSGFAAYTVGAAPFSFDQDANTVRADAAVTRASGKHEAKIGGTFQHSAFRSFQENGDVVRDLRVVDASGLLATPGQAGTFVRYGEAVRTDDAAWTASFFVQDRWRVTRNLLVSFGLRGDYQSFVQELFPAPRIGFALDPVGNRRTRFFGNAGLYYDNVYANALQFGQRPETLRGDVLFADPFSASARGFAQIPITRIWKEALSTPLRSQERDAVAFASPRVVDRYRVDEGLSAPVNRSFMIGLEQRIGKKTRTQLSFSMVARMHQLRTRTETASVGRNPGEPDVRDVILESAGQGKYEQWAFEVQRALSKEWNMNMSYVQSKSTGPIAPPDDPVDPNDVLYVDGPLPNSRPHVAKLQAHGRIGGKANLLVSADFSWQSGAPVTARMVLPNGDTVYPLGRNSLRLPPSRQLNLGLQRSFAILEDKATVTARLSVFNLLNDMNVFGAIATFRTPEGSSDPLAFAPLRPELLVTDVDVGRSMELGITFAF